MAQFGDPNQWADTAQWINNPPMQLTTSGTTNVYLGQMASQPAYVEPAKEKTPMEWLRGEVEEMCAVGRSAL